MNVQEIRNGENQLTGYLIDGRLTVPLLETSRHYKAIQKWIAEGNTPEPPTEPTATPKTKFSAREFLRKLTTDEKVALKTSDDLQVQLWYDEMIAADFIDIEDPAVSDAIDYGIYKEIFTRQRKAQLLTPE